MKTYKEFITERNKFEKYLLQKGIKNIDKLVRKNPKAFENVKDQISNQIKNLRFDPLRDEAILIGVNNLKKYMNANKDFDPTGALLNVEDLMKVNLAHHNINADLNKEVKYQTDQARFYKIQVEQLKKENQELRNKQTEFIKQFRNKGDM